MPLELGKGCSAELLKRAEIQPCSEWGVKRTSVQSWVASGNQRGLLTMCAAFYGARLTFLIGRDPGSTSLLPEIMPGLPIPSRPASKSWCGPRLIARYEAPPSCESL
ncbi:hypothetical protein NDU88_003306 [Pleurodeles waltl]|uniref:Uncharacterized protein n=1 Tax=Pleurodeles waltl TaxID=8319 RepID=A0AAV7KUI8_PLEWA|nr:hypothetical protein NDU88_003306 [Pleurodeles waltl]